MEIEQKGDGQWHFSLGPMERWILAIASASLIGMAIFIFNSITSRQDKQGDAQQNMVTQMAVMNGQLTTLSTQLADIPGLANRTTKLEANQTELTRRVGRLEDVGSAKAREWTR